MLRLKSGKYDLLFHVKVNSEMVHVVLTMSFLPISFEWRNDVLGIVLLLSSILTNETCVMEVIRCTKCRFRKGRQIWCRI